jgi:hypothetical protein
LARNAKNPSQVHVKALESVEKYLAATRNLSLSLGGADKMVKLFGYCDAGRRAGNDTKSRLGQCWFLSRDSGAVYWKSSLAKLISLSSTEAEIDALVEAIKDCTWIRGLLNEIGYPQLEPTIIYQDNKSAITLSEIDSLPTRTRHIVNRLSYIKQEIEIGTIQLKYVPSKLMVADVLTKLLPALGHQYCTRILLLGHTDKDPMENI